MTSSLLTPSRTISVVVAHPDPAYRDALASAIDTRPYLRLVGDTADGIEAARLIAGRHPDVAVMAIRAHDLDAIAICEQVKARGNGSRTRFILMDARPDPSRVKQAIDAGAAGYVANDLPPERILGAVLRVARGGTDFSPATHWAAAA